MTISTTKLIFLVSLFFVLFDNSAFFHHVLQIYPLSLKNLGFLISLAIGLLTFIMLFLTLLSSKLTTKPVLILFLILSAAASYFMNNYNVVIDHIMIQNIFQTNLAETSDLLNPELLYYCMLLGVLPAFFVYRVRIEPETFRNTVLKRIKIAFLSICIIFGSILLFSKFYTSFFREHKPLRYYTNPVYYVYSAGKYVNRKFKTSKTVIQPLGLDAKMSATDSDRELIILVVGEAARADRFSLNGYQRETNPLLQQEDIISFTNMYSCGTSTAYSVPCMFSVLPRNEYSDSKGASIENLLDVLQHAHVNVQWRDNNSNSKHIAGNVPYYNYQLPSVNSECDTECRDMGMLTGLQEYINNQPKGDIFIVLHQMGNHGPAYYKRYPTAFEKFTPVCKTNQIDECSKEEIGNGYDNAILYTDFFLDQIIKLLKNNSQQFETAMVYMSDHGESLGEYGLYLHGLPYQMAPDTQKHIASVFWFGENFHLDRKSLREKASKRFSHDNLFHTILGMMEIETSIYDKRLDILQN
ncbi:MAG TPA: phosphoethanolamine--lipid A transferase [Desulfocapsa sulfexigens]|nr:phosphoethanolamine--lipid A transferase [Desulfocapsa sulfexigens]